MVQKENTLRLLIAEESLNDAEMLISVLRNAGHPVRATHAEDDEDVREHLDEKAFDLFLCSLGLETLPLELAHQLVQQSGKDIPLLAVSAHDDTDRRRQALTQGAADLVNKDDLDHLQQVITRELKHLEDRRRLKRLEAALRETERRCYALLDSSRDAIAYVHEGMHIYANAAYLEKFGVASFEDIEGMPLLDMASSSDQGKLKEFLRNYQKGKVDSNQLELDMNAAEDTPLSVTMSFSEASIEGEPCTQILLREKVSEQATGALSTQDVLTGLYNRQYFTEQVQAQLDRGLEDEAASSGLLYIHLDNLDNLRQTLGLTAIDGAVAELARVIEDEVGDEGTAARFADEVFTVLLTGKGVHETIALAEALRQRIEEHVADTDGATVTTTASIGAAMLSDGGSASQTINASHQACELARTSGGNQVHLHASEEEAESGREGNLRSRLEAALQDDDFALAYQPIACLKGDGRERYEVRIRLKDEDGEMIPPADFVPRAEQLGLMPRIDHWVVENALKVLAKRTAAGQDTVLFVKLSGRTLAEHQAFLEFLKAQLNVYKVEANRLIFQVNEPVAVTQLNHAKEVFRGLKTLHAGFSLDHFGSGLNPFQLIKHLPADYLKLDATLTQDLSANAENQASVKQLIDTAHSMNRKIIAGYLEDVGSLAMLWQYETDFVQGHFLAEPGPDMDYDFSGMVI